MVLNFAKSCKASYKVIKELAAQLQLHVAKDLRQAQAQAEQDVARRAASERVSLRSRDYSLEANVNLVRQERDRRDQRRKPASAHTPHRANKDNTANKTSRKSSNKQAEDNPSAHQAPEAGPSRIPLSERVNFQPSNIMHGSMNMPGQTSYIQGQRWCPNIAINVPCPSPHLPPNCCDDCSKYRRSSQVRLTSHLKCRSGCLKAASPSKTDVG